MYLLKNLGGKMIYGLSLGSGGARGIAHLAFLQEIKKRNYKFEIVTGTSAGAIIGALYAIDPEKDYTFLFKEVMEKNESTIKKLSKELNSGINVLKKMITSKSVIENNFAYKMFKDFYGKKKFSECKLKLGVVAFDIISGENVEITEGYVIDAVMASSCVPGAFKPMQLGGMEIVDGAVLTEIPVNLAKKLGAQYVVANHVSPIILEKEYFNGMQYLEYLDEYKVEFITQDELKNAEEIYTFNGENFWYEFFEYENVLKNAKEIYGSVML
jgi:NTE family protein